MVETMFFLTLSFIIFVVAKGQDASSRTNKVNSLDPGKMGKDERLDRKMANDELVETWRQKKSIENVKNREKSTSIKPITINRQNAILEQVKAGGQGQSGSRLKFGGLKPGEIRERIQFKVEEKNSREELFDRTRPFPYNASFVGRIFFRGRRKFRGEKGVLKLPDDSAQFPRRYYPSERFNVSRQISSNEFKYPRRQSLPGEPNESDKQKLPNGPIKIADKSEFQQDRMKGEQTQYRGYRRYPRSNQFGEQNSSGELNEIGGKRYPIANELSGELVKTGLRYPKKPMHSNEPAIKVKFRKDESTAKPLPTVEPKLSGDRTPNAGSVLSSVQSIFGKIFNSGRQKPTESLSFNRPKLSEAFVNINAPRPAGKPEQFSLQNHPGELIPYGESLYLREQKHTGEAVHSNGPGIKVKLRENESKAKPLPSVEQKLPGERNANGGSVLSSVQSIFGKIFNVGRQKLTESLSFNGPKLSEPFVKINAPRPAGKPEQFSLQNHPGNLPERLKFHGLQPTDESELQLPRFKLRNYHQVDINRHKHPESSSNEDQNQLPGRRIMYRKGIFDDRNQLPYRKSLNRKGIFDNQNEFSEHRQPLGMRENSDSDDVDEKGPSIREREDPKRRVVLIIPVPKGMGERMKDYEGIVAFLRQLFPRVFEA
nr:uncharacterized protein LOC112210874 [Halyomorpha halys]